MSAPGREPRRSVISIGTNSTRALVVAFDGAPAVLLHRSTGTRIGEGLRESGRLRDDAMRRTLEAIEGHVAAIREFRARLSVIATSALRRANNAPEFRESVRAITGAPLEIISGEEEARCSYEGAVSALPASRSYGVLDVGGGSTEYAIRQAHLSCEIGAVRLTERLPSLRDICAPSDLAEARKTAREALEPLRVFEPQECLVAVGGSATTACAVISGGSNEYVTHLERGMLSELVELLASLPLERRKELPGIVAQRADILLAGALIVDEACGLTGHARARVSANDLLLGYLLRH